MRSLRLALLLAGLLVLCAPAVASAPTPMLPPVPRRLAAASEWVMSLWLPYDEASLTALDATARARGLAGRPPHARGARRRHGHRDLRALAGRSSPRAPTSARGAAGGRSTPSHDTLSQAHLARHVLFHVFHSPALATASPDSSG